MFFEHPPLPEPDYVLRVNVDHPLDDMAIYNQQQVVTGEYRDFSCFNSNERHAYRPLSPTLLKKVNAIPKPFSMFCYNDDSITYCPELLVLAQVGFAIAQHNLGACYQKGDGIRQDHVQAIKWFKRAARQEFEYAQITLAYCYRDGISVKENQRLSAYWFRRVIKNDGFMKKEAHIGLAEYYENELLDIYGRDLPHRKRAAELGDTESLYHYGWALYCSPFRSRLIEGFCWLLKASANGDKAADRTVQEITGRASKQTAGGIWLVPKWDFYD